MKKIPLGRGLFALVDDADFEKVNRWKWHAGARLNFPLTPLGGARDLGVANRPELAQQSVLPVG